MLEQAHHLYQFVRYGVVGISLCIAGTALLAFLVEVLGVPYLIGYASVFLVLTSLGYVLNSTFTFRHGRIDERGRLLRYCGVSLLGLVGNLLAMWVLVDLLAVQYAIATVLVAAGVALLSYAGHSIFTFAVRKRARGEALER